MVQQKLDLLFYRSLPRLPECQRFPQRPKIAARPIHACKISSRRSHAQFMGKLIVYGCAKACVRFADSRVSRAGLRVGGLATGDFGCGAHGRIPMSDLSMSRDTRSLSIVTASARQGVASSGTKPRQSRNPAPSMTIRVRIGQA